MDTYKTIKEEAFDEYVIKHSKFIGYIKPVTTQEEAIDFINGIKSKHWDATHNVFAYSLREGQITRYSDDGEPQGTAGMPVLDVLQKSELTDCVVVVTRYFGGILLGAGGLVRAYSHTAKLAVDKGRIKTMASCSVLRIVCDYNLYGKLNTFIPSAGGIIDKATFTESITIDMHIPTDLLQKFSEKLLDLSNGKAKPELICEKFDEIK